MAGVITRGDVWMYGFRDPDKRRPVVVITREEVIPLLHAVMVAPITSVNLDHVQTVEQAGLQRRVGRLGPAKMREVCRTLAIAAGCAD